MLLLDAAFGEIAGVTEILSIRTTGQALRMGTRTPHHHHDEIAGFDA